MPDIDLTDIQSHYSVVTFRVDPAGVSGTCDALTPRLRIPFEYTLKPITTKEQTHQA
jgi:hypothetical protein